MKEPNLNHLLYFWAAAQAGSIAAAARRLGVGRPAVSAQIAALEGSLGLSLLRRGARQIVLTEAGRQLFVHAERIFAAAGDFAAAAERLREDRSPRLRVGFAPSVARSFLADALAPRPDGDPVRLACRCAAPEALVGELALRRIDLAFVDALPALPRDARLERCEIASDHVALIAARGGAAIGGAAIANATGGAADVGAAVAGAPGCAAGLDATALARLPLVVPPRGVALRDEIDGWLAARGFAATIAAECDDGALAVRLAARGLGACPVPARAVARHCREHGLEHVGTLEGARLTWHALAPSGGFARKSVIAVLERARAHGPAAAAS